MEVKRLGTISITNKKSNSAHSTANKHHKHLIYTDQMNNIVHTVRFQVPTANPNALLIHHETSLCKDTDYNNY